MAHVWSYSLQFSSKKLYIQVSLKKGTDKQHIYPMKHYSAIKKNKENYHILIWKGIQAKLLI